MEVLSTVLTIILVVISIALIVVVMMQEGKAGGLGAIAGAAGDSYVSRNQRHTPEGRLRTITRVLGAAFVVLALAINVIENLAA